MCSQHQRFSKYNILFCLQTNANKVVEGEKGAQADQGEKSESNGVLQENCDSEEVIEVYV